MWARSSCRGRGGARAARGVAGLQDGAACAPHTPCPRIPVPRALPLERAHGLNTGCQLRPQGRWSVSTQARPHPCSRSALQVWIGDAWLSRTEAERAPRVTWASLVRLHLANTR